MKRARVLAMILLAAAQAACVSPQVRTERDALAAYNRCVSAVQDSNRAMYESCLSARLKQERAGDAPPLSEQTLAAYRDVRPYATQVRSVEIGAGLQRVQLQTLNYTNLIDRRVEHVETIVLVREDGRWVIDKDCCEYSASTILED